MANSGRYRVEGLTREYEPGLDAIFFGINPASTAAGAGHNFSSASNRFCCGERSEARHRFLQNRTTHDIDAHSASQLV